jgi:hypothetical protein
VVLEEHEQVVVYSDEFRRRDHVPSEKSSYR